VIHEINRRSFGVTKGQDFCHAFNNACDEIIPNEWGETESMKNNGNSEDIRWQDCDVWSWRTPDDNKRLRILEIGEIDDVQKLFKQIEITSEVLYRGDNLGNLARTYDSKSNKSNVPGAVSESRLAEISEKLFFFGQKGKVFWDKSILNQNACKLLLDLNMCIEKSLERLVQKICHLISSKTSKVAKSENISQPLRDAFNKLRENGREVLNMLDFSEKKALRDLLIFYLHNCSTSMFSTSLISLSPDIEVALRFASGRDGTDSGCVIVAFLPPKWQDRAARLTNTCRYREILNRIGLPLEKFVHDKDAEIALFGAIFPHYTVCLLDIQKKVVIWNPEIFKASEMKRDKIPWEGIPIDQTDFLNRLGKETAFACGLIRDHDGNDFQISPSGEK